MPRPTPTGRRQCRYSSIGNLRPSRLVAVMNNSELAIKCVLQRLIKSEPERDVGNIVTEGRNHIPIPVFYELVINYLLTLLLIF
jgi:hypothetical protein